MIGWSDEVDCIIAYYHSKKDSCIIHIMSLFGANKPKGITEEELTFIRGELLTAPFGHNAEKLSERQVEELIEDLQLTMDADSSEDIQRGWKQVIKEEAEAIEKHAANNKGLKYSTAQLEHIHKVFQKYIDINKHKSLF